MNKECISSKYQPAASAPSFEEYEGRNDNILVISPHPDDDVLGAGGTMAEAAAQGKGVFSVYVTDGRGSPRKDRGITDEEMASCRKNEALASLKAVGAAGGFFLERRSQELTGAGGAEAREELEKIVEILRPSEVYLPAPYERHKTHQLCTALILDVLRVAGGWPMEVLGYSLWGCFWGGKKRIVRDISSVIRKKVEAVLAHASQIEYKNYHQGILGKNNYEAVFLESHEIQKASFVEIFLDMGELLTRKDLSINAFTDEDLKSFQNAYLPIP